MMFPEERITQEFVDYLYAHYDDNYHRHIKRVASSLGPLVYKVFQLDPNAHIGYTRQLHFSYQGKTFRGRFSHEDGGKLQLVEMNGHSELAEVSAIRNLREAMEIDLRVELNGWLGADDALASSV